MDEKDFFWATEDGNEKDLKDILRNNPNLDVLPSCWLVSMERPPAFGCC